MDAWTTMSLTHSDGYLFTLGADLDHSHTYEICQCQFGEHPDIRTNSSTTGTPSGMRISVVRSVVMKPKRSFMRIARGCLFASSLTVGRCIIGLARHRR